MMEHQCLSYVVCKHFWNDVFQFKVHAYVHDWSTIAGGRWWGSVIGQTPLAVIKKSYDSLQSSVVMAREKSFEWVQHTRKNTINHDWWWEAGNSSYNNPETDKSRSDVNRCMFTSIGQRSHDCMHTPLMANKNNLLNIHWRYTENTIKIYCHQV